MPRKPIDPNAPTLIREDQTPTVVRGHSGPNAPTLILEDTPTRMAEPTPIQADTPFSWDMHVVVFATQGYAAGTIEHISTLGLFHSTPQQLPVDTPVKLQLDLPGGARLVKGVIRTIRQARGLDRPAGLGIDFVDLDPVVVEQLKSLLRGNPPSGTPGITMRRGE